MDKLKALVAMVACGVVPLAGAQQVYSTVAPPPPERAQARAEVNLRAGPGTQHAVVGKVARGGWLELRECDSPPGWCEVVVAAPDRAWVSAAHLARAGSGLRADTGAPTHIEVPPPAGPPIVIVVDGVRGPRR